MRNRLAVGFPIFLASINMRAGLVLIGPLIPILEKYIDLYKSNPTKCGVYGLEKEFYYYCCQMNTTLPLGTKISFQTLFEFAESNATTISKNKRKTIEQRAEKVASLQSDEPHLVWCDTNDEADKLKAWRQLSLDEQKEKLVAFAEKFRMTMDKDVWDEFQKDLIKKLRAKYFVSRPIINWHKNSQSILEINSLVIHPSCFYWEEE